VDQKNARRACLLSDTHGQLDDRILSVASSCDLILHAGDVGNAQVLSTLAATGRAVAAVLGNNDTAAKWPANDHHELESLPERALVDLPGGRIAIEHGHRINPVDRRHEKLRARYPDCRMVLYGHSHRLLIDASEDPWIVNPGAAGHSRTFGGPSCLLLEIADKHWRITEHRFPLRKVVTQRRPDRWNR
jgi:hypothetical protein